MFDKQPGGHVSPCPLRLAPGRTARGAPGRGPPAEPTAGVKLPVGWEGASWLSLQTLQQEAQGHGAAAEPAGGWAGHVGRDAQEASADAQLPGKLAWVPGPWLLAGKPVPRGPPSSPGPCVCSTPCLTKPLPGQLPPESRCESHHLWRRN